MKNLQKFTFLGLLLILLSFNAIAQNNAFDNDIRKLLKITKTEESFQQMLPTMINQFKALRPDIPSSVWNTMQKEFHKEGSSGLVDKMIPLYKKHFTHADIKGLINFFESPVGKKYADKTPALTQESMVIGQEWGKELAIKVQQKLKKKGY